MQVVNKVVLGVGSVALMLAGCGDKGAVQTPQKAKESISAQLEKMGRLKIEHTTSAAVPPCGGLACN